MAISALLPRGFPWADFVSGRYGLTQAQTALEAVAAQQVVKALIVPH